MNDVSYSKVGAFYCIGDNIVYQAIKIKYLVHNSFAYNYGGHDDIWEIFTGTEEYSYYRELDDTYYFPRGRIVYVVSSGRFILYIDPKAYTERMIRKLMKVYNISRDVCDIVTDDEHYNVSTQLADDIIPDEIDGDFDIDEYIRKVFSVTEEAYRDTDTRHRVTSILTGNEFNNN